MICTLGRSEEEVADALVMKNIVWNHLGFSTSEQLLEWIQAIRRQQASAVVGETEQVKPRDYTE